MTNKQPEALRLADLLENEKHVTDLALFKAAAELRKLHNQNKDMREILQRMIDDKGFMCECGIGNELFDAIEVLLRRELI